MARLTGIIHYSKLDTSSRLKKMLACLSDGNWHSTAELSHRCHNYAVSTTISELRANGKDIESRCVVMEISKARYYEYRLVEAGIGDQGPGTRKNPCQGCRTYHAVSDDDPRCALEMEGVCTL